MHSLYCNEGVGALDIFKTESRVEGEGAYAAHFSMGGIFSCLFIFCYHGN